MSNDAPHEPPPPATCPRCHSAVVEALGHAQSTTEWFTCRACGNVWSAKGPAKPE